MNCKICNKNLYKSITIQSIFTKTNIHTDCQKLFKLNPKIEVIPIKNNSIHFSYFFDYSHELNYEYLYKRLLIKSLLSIEDADDWSIIFLYEKEEYEKLSDEAKYLLLHFGHNPILFISMFAY